MDAWNQSLARAVTQSWLPVIEVDGRDPFKMGIAIGQRFASMIKSRVVKDPVLRSQLIPFATSVKGEQLIRDLSASNKGRYPRYWQELEGIAQGSGVSLLEVLLLNFRKEVLPFISLDGPFQQNGYAEECSDVLVCSAIGVIAHNEDANVTLKDHVYLVHASLPNDAAFVAYTYAGELPSCAFGFNSYGVGFTLNAVPLKLEEVILGGVGRNFVSRDLLEVSNFDAALKCIQSDNLSVGHSYNIMDMGTRKIVNVETASKGRFSLQEIGSEPFFHANMYKHLEVLQMEDQSSLHREARAAQLPKSTTHDILRVLGDVQDHNYPIYMQGPNLLTLCTVLMDLDAKMFTIYSGNPSDERAELDWQLC